MAAARVEPAPNAVRQPRAAQAASAVPQMPEAAPRQSASHNRGRNGLPAQPAFRRIHRIDSLFLLDYGPSVCHRMVTTVLRSARLRSTTRFHPLLGPGASATAISFGTISISTGTPGSAPSRVPVEADVPSIVIDAFFCSFPDHVITPEEGTTGRAGGGVAFGRTLSGAGAGGLGSAVSGGGITAGGAAGGGGTAAGLNRTCGGGAGSGCGGGENACALAGGFAGMVRVGRAAGNAVELVSPASAADGAGRGRSAAGRPVSPDAEGTVGEVAAAGTGSAPVSPT
jgi:hypothetical protein